MKYMFTYILLSFSFLGFSQNKLSKLLEKHNTESVPYIYISEVQTTDNAVFLDAREPEEFKISHVKNAICVGFDEFVLDKVIDQIPDKNQEIIVYCSLGIRSEIVAQKLIDSGYTNVKNLYGGIFEWKNNDLTVYNDQDIETDSVHAFSKQWGKWLKKGVKVYPKSETDER
ncbi:MAG: rhodanese-like domain-containing protein [Psychroserpens sp.]|nr:rhodanese-like domain-containing protein [Psychroserpens sp.]